MGFFSRITEQITQFYTTLSPSKKIALVLTGLGLLTALVVILLWTGGKSYQLLAQNLASEDATAIMRMLRQKKIPFKVEEDGKSIYVPPEAIYDLRLELATQGMTQANIVGYEVFDKQSFGTTSFVQKINQKRALEGELTRTINEIRGVKRTRVHLALPATSTFKEDQKKATASVIIDMEPGLQLNEKQIQGIQRLVANAIEGMDFNDVTITDSTGKILSKNSLDPLAAKTATLMEVQQKIESEYEKKIEEILSRVVGEGKVIAKVGVDLDFTQSIETQTQYDQEGAAIKAEQKETMVADGSRPVPGGVPGAVSNTPGPAPASAVGVPAITSNNQRAFETKNYNVPEKIIRSTKAPYSIKRLTVAVLVDGIYKKDAAQGTASDRSIASTAYTPWPEDKLQEFKTLVASALALDPKRGDIVEVKNMQFRHEDVLDAEAQIAAFEKKKLVSNLIQYALIGLIIGFFFFFVVRPFVKWLTDNTVDSVESFLPKTVEELEKMQAGELGQEISELEEAIPVIVDKVDPEKVEGEMIKEKVVTLIENNPQKAALILHEWIASATSQANSSKKGQDSKKQA
jgi:flagellar M-ring protein FliF